MKIRFWMSCLLLLMLPWMASAEVRLTLSADVAAACSPLDFVVEGDPAPAYRYTLLHEGSKLFTAESGRAAGSCVPLETGEYTLQVAALYENGEESVEAAFTVTEALSAALAALPPAMKTGEPLKVRMLHSGGAGNERYFYTIVSNGQTLLHTEGGADWHWVPSEAGEYTLLAAVRDAGGAMAEARAAFSVEEGGGMSAEATGGDLGAHGGQKSWTIYAVQPWTAHTDADFLTLENAEGCSGDPLTVTVHTPTDEYREGVIQLHSGSHQMMLTVAQSAGHGVDEEVSLFAPVQSLYADGQLHAVWTGARGSRSFRIDAEEAWQAETQDDFIHMEERENELVLTVEEPTDASVRSGLVTVAGGGSSAYIHVYQLPAVQARDADAAAAPLPAEDDIALYSQSSGLWKDKKYGGSNLQKSGCAIFALSHALQCLGFEGEEITPEALAKKYAFCLREDGTINSTLVGNAGDDLGFKTRYELYHDLRTIRSKAEEGAVFSFAVVSGHIAMVAEVSSDGSMVRVIDSAPSATWERIGENKLYLEKDGSYAAIEDLADIPGIRYYPETDAFGAATYWLESSYAARRGLRLIQPE